MINDKNWVPWIINICLIVFVIALLYNESSFKDKREIEKVYKAYIEDFIENDFEGIASYFEPPVNFKNFDIEGDPISSSPSNKIDILHGSVPEVFM